MTEKSKKAIHPPIEFPDWAPQALQDLYVDFQDTPGRSRDSVLFALLTNPNMEYVWRSLGRKADKPPRWELGLFLACARARTGARRPPKGAGEIVGELTEIAQQARALSEAIATHRSLWGHQSLEASPLALLVDGDLESLTRWLVRPDLEQRTNLKKQLIMMANTRPGESLRGGVTLSVALERLAQLAEQEKILSEGIQPIVIRKGKSGAKHGTEVRFFVRELGDYFRTTYGSAHIRTTARVARAVFGKNINADYVQGALRFAPPRTKSPLTLRALRAQL
jgi:hypothetical protein